MSAVVMARSPVGPVELVLEILPLNIQLLGAIEYMDFFVLQTMRLYREYQVSVSTWPTPTGL